MDLTVARGGKFSFTIESSDLVKGLRTTKQNPRNKDSLIACTGAIGNDGVLSVMDSITQLATTAITDGFPFPQIFVFPNMVIICGLKKVYELVGGSLVLKYTATTVGGTWTAEAFDDYVYMSNGREAVIRDAGSKAYALSTTQPTATTICNFNRQVIIGAPDAHTLGADLVLDVDEMTLVNSITGSISTT